MTAAEFAFALNGRRVGNGKWMAKCPSHGDRHASLSISVGRKQPVMFRCQSQNCSPDSILEAMGIRWSDILAGGREVTPEIRRKYSDGKRLEVMQMKWEAYFLCKTVFDVERAECWRKLMRSLESDMVYLRRRMFDWDREAGEYERKVSGARRTQMWAEVGL